MKSALLAALLGATLFVAPFTYAQTATVTATCKDGTSFSGTSRSGACKGHKGVDTWGSAAAATPAAGAPASRVATPVKPNAAAAAKTGGPGQVWVNTASKVYHCPGDRYYGKTKAGEFMSQDAAKAAGNHPSGGKACPS